MKRLWQWFPGAVVVMMSVGVLMSLMAARQAVDHRETFIKGMSEVSLNPPETPPAINQESIDAALAMYHIAVPDHVEPPRLDPQLEDRGLTVSRGWGSKLEVTVGPGAFSSWALLGSTLAHELEVHCHQNFTMIRILDLLGLNGTDTAEREAYAHELADAKRFHLADIDRISIQETMDFYYPVKTESSGISNILSQGMVDLLARSTRSTQPVR